MKNLFNLGSIFGELGHARKSKNNRKLSSIRENVVAENDLAMPEFEIRLASLLCDEKLEAGTFKLGAIQFVRQTHYAGDYFYGPIENITSVAPGETLEIVVRTKREKTFESEITDSVESTNKSDRETSNQSELINRTLRRTVDSSGLSLGGGVPMMTASVQSSQTSESAAELIDKKLRAETEKLSSEIRRSTIVTTKSGQSESYEDESRRLIVNKSQQKAMTVSIRRMHRVIRVVQQELVEKRLSALVLDINGSELKFPRPINAASGDVVAILSKLRLPSLTRGLVRFGTLPDNATSEATLSAAMRGRSVSFECEFAFASEEIRDAIFRLLIDRGVIQDWNQNSKFKYIKRGAIGLSPLLNSTLSQIIEADRIIHVTIPASDPFPEQKWTEYIQDNATFNLQPNGKAGLRWAGVRSVPPEWHPEVFRDFLNGASVRLNLAGLAVLPEWGDLDDFQKSLLEYQKNRIELNEKIDEIEKKNTSIRKFKRTSGDLRQEEREVAIQWLKDRAESVNQELFGTIRENLMLSDAYLIPSAWASGVPTQPENYICSDVPSRVDLYSALGWDIQWDADEYRNELINSEIVRIVVPAKIDSSPADMKVLAETLGFIEVSSDAGRVAEEITKRRSKMLDSYLLRGYVQGKLQAVESNVLSDYQIKVPIPGHFFDIVE